MTPKELGARIKAGENWRLVTHEERINKIISDLSGENDINADTRIFDDLGYDSLVAIELIMTLEEEFDIEINDIEVAKMASVGEIYQYIGAMVGG